MSTEAKPSDDNGAQAPPEEAPPPAADAADAAALARLRAVLAEASALLASAEPLRPRRVARLRRRLEECAAAAGCDAALGAQAENAVARLGQRLERESARLEQRHRELLDVLGRIEAALEEGNLQQALALRRRADARLARMPMLTAEQRAAIEARLHALQPRLRELQDWRHWGTGLAREQLIAEIEALEEADVHPKQRAERIRRARETWKSWDHTGDQAERALWQHFDEACTRAYAPCQRYFAGLAEQRRRNGERREAICAELEHVYEQTDWQRPDWRALDKLLRQASQEWRRPLGLERKERRRLEERFAGVCERFEAHLAEERARCLRRRQSLIEEVQRLAEAPALAEAVAATQRAQREWRPTVLAPRPREQELWQAFRSACDAVFARRDAERRQRDDARAASLDARRELCRRLEALVEGDGAALGDAEAQLARAREEWRRLGDAPRGAAASAEQRFRGACQRLGERIDAARQRGEARRDEQLCRRADLCARVERAAQEEDDAETRARTVAAARDEWEALLPLEDALEEAAAQRFAHACAAALEGGAALTALAAGHAANLAARAELCLRLEVLAEVESPPEHAQARMQLQVERLSAAMSGAARGGAPSAGARELKRRYWLTGAVPPHEEARLAQRFERALAALGARRARG